MILNTGTRTDIPAFFHKWFLKRIDEGFVLSKNPYNNQIYKYNFDPKTVDCICFCSKNPKPLVRNLDNLSDYRQFWFVTITGCISFATNVVRGDTIKNRNSAGSVERRWRGDGITDEMRAREKAICEVAKVKDIGEVSDGFHTFNGLYEQRMILFAALVKAYKDKAWKSYRHEDGEYCFGGGWFIVGIDTPEGSYTYHYENKYWDMFDCVDLPRAKHWDGHTEADAETRLMSLKPEPHWIPVTERLPEPYRG